MTREIVHSPARAAPALQASLACCGCTFQMGAACPTGHHFWCSPAAILITPLHSHQRHRPTLVYGLGTPTPRGGTLTLTLGLSVGAPQSTKSCQQHRSLQVVPVFVKQPFSFDACKSWPWPPTPTADKKSPVRVREEGTPSPALLSEQETHVNTTSRKKLALQALPAHV